MLEDYKCENCKMNLVDLKAVDYLRTPPTFGDLLLCGNCGGPNVVTTTGTRLMTTEEFDALEPEELKDLEFAWRAVRRKIQVEGNKVVLWTPNGHS